MSASKETATKNKDQAPAIYTDSVLNRLNELEERCTQLETTLKDTVTFDTLAARLTGMKTVKRRRAKHERSEEENTAFQAKMVAAKKAKERERQQAAKAESKK